MNTIYNDAKHQVTNNNLGAKAYFMIVSQLGSFDFKRTK